MNDQRVQEGLERLFDSNQANASWGITVLRHDSVAASNAIAGVRALRLPRLRGLGTLIPF